MQGAGHSSTFMVTGHRREDTLVLIDGSSYLFRAYHAMPGFTNSQGLPTGAVYGVTNMLRKLLAEWNPEYVAVVFDAKEKTFREDLYPQYKANRAETPEDLVPQIQWVHDIVRAMGLPVIVEAGVEADDVIGTLAARASAEGMHTVISSSDKDMAQLVNDRVTVVNTMSNTTFDRVGVIEKFGVPPERIVDYLALVGDTVDNVPGIPKVGPKTAAKWLGEYGSLDAIVENADRIGGAVGESLRAHIDRLPLARTLVTIKCDVELPMGPRELRRVPADDGRLREIYTELDFRSWLPDALGAEGAGDEGRRRAPPISHRPVTHTRSADHAKPAAGMAGRGTYETILTMDALHDWVKRLDAAGGFCFDTETTSLDTLSADLVGLSFSDRVGEGIYIPVGHHYLGAPKQLALEEVLEAVRPLLEDPACTKIAQNLKFDLNVLRRFDVNVAGPCFDTMLESYVLDSTATRHDMDSLAEKYLGYRTITYDELTGTGKSRRNFSEVEVEAAAEYSAEDADVTFRLHETLWPRLDVEPGLRRVFTEIEMPLVPVLARMERTGVRIDTAMLRSHSRELDREIRQVEEEAYREAGERFNLASPRQVQEVLFDRLGIAAGRKTPKGQLSTADDVLQELALTHALPEIILRHRTLSKLKSTYTDKLPAMIHPATGRVHTSYHQAVTATGRLSSSDPNLQNIPARTDEGRKIRQAFVAGPGRKIISADYSQIELRIMAHFSGDEGLLRAFAAGGDVHRATAAELHGIPQEMVSADQRRSAKAVNFGLMYGMSAFGLSQQLKIDVPVAQQYMDLYFDRYPRVKAFMERTREEARRKGYVETAFGRRLYLPEINSGNRNRRQYAERTAINAPMQGTAADIIKLAMIVVDEWIQTSGLEILMIMQVHDELVFEAPEGQAEEAAVRIKALMSGVANLAVPLVVDAGIGDNWDEAH